MAYSRRDIDFVMEVFSTLDQAKDKFLVTLVADTFEICEAESYALVGGWMASGAGNVEFRADKYLAGRC